jgi:acyl carrier protein
VSIDQDDLERRVVAVVAEALDVEPAKVTRYASLKDDLGADSIDFLDIVFRLETAFGLRISEEEIWKGSIDADDPAALAAGLERLRARMPGFDWNRFPAEPGRDDLPRLITVQTIFDYLAPRLGAAG